MNYVTLQNNTQTESERQREYLAERLSKVFHKKDRELEIAYGLRDEDGPTTFDELIQRIKDGKYRMDESIKGTDPIRYESPINFMRWRTKERDRAGYEIAFKALQAKRDDAEEIIQIKSLDEGLAALQAFKA